MSKKTENEKRSYLVTYEYRGVVTVEIIANSSKDAKVLGIERADDLINGYLSIYRTVSRKVNDERAGGS